MAESTVKQAGKFGLVGIANTATYFIILNVVLQLFGIPKEQAALATFPAAAVAMIQSYLLNRKFTFHDNSQSAAKPVLFFSMTALGQFIFQPALVQFFSVVFDLPGRIALNILNYIGPLHSLVAAIAGKRGVEDFVIVNAAAALTVGVVMVYNFLSYKFLVFKK